MRYSGSWPHIHLQMQSCVGFPVSRRQECVGVWDCVCVCAVGWYVEEEGGRVYGLKRGGVEAWEEETSKTMGEIGSPRSDKAGRGVQRQRKRDPPRDRERHACLPSGSIQLFTHSTLSGLSATTSAQAEVKMSSLIKRVCGGLNVCFLLSLDSFVWFCFFLYKCWSCLLFLGKPPSLLHLSVSCLEWQNKFKISK